jgi:outer membrane protein assembly factor BamB
MSFNHRFPLAVLALTCMLAPVTPADPVPGWPQWRGQERDGSIGGAAWPGNLDHLRLDWRVELGRGYPGPIVAADRVFVVETVDEDTVAVRALHRETGRELWKHSWGAGGKVPFFARRNGDWVRSTPAFDGRLLYAGDMQEVLVALDVENGRERWRVDFPARFGTSVPDFGFASSPLVDEGAVYVQAANSVVKLSAETGETLWRALQHDGAMTSSGAFSSPVIATLAGTRQLVVQTRQALHGVALDSGEVLWSQPVPNYRGMNILTPAIHGDSIFTSPYRERSYLFQVGRDGEGRFQVRETWTHPATGYMSSPVIIDGHAYLHLGNQRLDCIDLTTGQSRWRSQPFGKYWSMVHQGDRLLALDADGTLRLVQAGPEEFRLLDSHRVSEQETWGHLAVSGDQIFIRELEGIAAYRWPSSRAAATRP